MRSPRIGVVVSLAAVLGLALTACGGGSDTEVRTQETSTSSTDPTSTGTSACDLPGASTDPQSTAGGSDVALLTDVRAGRQACADRVEFEFRTGIAGATIEYQPGPFTVGESGQPLTVAGGAFLVVRLEPAAGVNLDEPDAPATYTGPSSIKPQGLTHVQEIRELSDFEGQLVWVIGLDDTRPFTVTSLTGPSRVSVEVG